MTLDPLLVAAGFSVAAPLVAGPAAARVVDAVPVRSRRVAEWFFIAAALGVALAVALLPHDRTRTLAVYLLPALPAFLVFLVWRLLLASAVVSLVPMYFVIASLTRGQPHHAPAIGLDAAIPLRPEWMLVYGSLYLFVVVLPLLVVRGGALVRRALQAYLTVILIAYAGFLLYPTVAPRPDLVSDVGFFAWTLGVAYELDPPYNCFPSLHVAYAFVSASACLRVHRGVGLGALVWATLISISTLYTKQHYVVDVVAGVLSAALAYALFLRGSPSDAVEARDRLLAPRRAGVVAALFVTMMAVAWVAYILRQ